MHLEITAVDPVVVRDHHARELHVLVLNALERAVESGDDELEPAERMLLELGELVLEVNSSLRHNPAAQPKRPET